MIVEGQDRGGKLLEKIHVHFSKRSQKKKSKNFTNHDEKMQYLVHPFFEVTYPSVYINIHAICCFEYMLVFVKQPLMV